MPTVGTKAYKEYMVAYAEAHPDQLPSSMEQVPEVDVEAVSQHPQMAGITYSRQQCQRCHVGVTGREKNVATSVEAGCFLLPRSLFQRGSV